jgi:hypothetical protein
MKNTKKPAPKPLDLKQDVVRGIFRIPLFFNVLHQYIVDEQGRKVDAGTVVKGREVARAIDDAVTCVEETFGFSSDIEPNDHFYDAAKRAKKLLRTSGCTVTV